MMRKGSGHVVVFVFAIVTVFAAGMWIGKIQRAEEEKKKVCGSECGHFWIHEEGHCVCLERSAERKP